MEPRPMILEDSPEIPAGAEEEVDAGEETVEQFFAHSKGNTVYISFATTDMKITIGINHDNATLEELVNAVKDLLSELRKRK
ncbi:hypothetical protein PFDSM3638_04095 [Pyrococcus furiosus DSM 3638]|uniref:Uncharacterized protein n=3 Tax=Pyrococcus furiosus TaxID=2261 RepID=Q8U2L2_PYRFU|nr:hypothetical protein [Pyrococcus furiosus]AAL80946.1 hypothetical protein PF0822 [Pyrococcus furiosus DSM 3638]AFN03608.1 hypothetical protein PFC_03285 [Pyrococcus furiosus COM1]QEK78495.1 hypothetical protein PFDSM3638_04095 [Pyrococcus furiosus DSM 3638]